MWSIELELIPVSVALSDQEYFYSLNGMRVYRKRKGGLKYVTDVMVAFKLWEKRKQFSESFILQNATISCFGCHCSAFNFCW